MKRKLLAVLGIVALLSGFLVAAPVMAGTPKPPAGLIPVDADPYFKGLTGKAIEAKAEAAAEQAAPTLEEAEAEWALDPTPPEVGEVWPLYTDGIWQDFTLRAKDGNAEIWVANDLSYCATDPRPPHVVEQGQVDYLLQQFNDVIYPSNTTYFGFTDDRDGSGAGKFVDLGYGWYGATDNPQRVMILVYNIIDEGYCDPEYPFYVAGYFSPGVNDDLANRNIIHIDSYDWANRIGFDVARPYLYEGTIAHEYEHAIHYDHDADEPSWVDEGMADLSGYLAGYGHEDGHIAYYMVYHRTPLTTWGGGLEDYGESYLFQLYLMENFGGSDLITALVNEPLNGVAGIENQLHLRGYPDVSFNDIYRDWTLANYLDDPGLTGSSGARLGYESLEIPSRDTQGYSIQWSIENYYGSDNAGNLPIPRYWGGYKSGTVQYPIDNVAPYGPMYLTYKGFQPQLISNFRAANISGVAAHGGEWELWGGRGDLLANTATLAAPIALGAGAELSFWTWYDIEPNWDFCFVQVSTDGATWTSLSNAHTTSVIDPGGIQTAKDNLPGFTGESGGWVQETFDLSAYEDESVYLRFFYVTDWATNEAGFYVDDVQIGGLADDLEAGSGNWVLDGFQRTTGLAVNDWELTFVNPVYENGKFSSYEIQDGNVYVEGAYQWDQTTLDTQALNQGEVTIILSNHLPELLSMPAQYRLLVEKGDASQ